MERASIVSKMRAWLPVLIAVTILGGCGGGVGLQKSSPQIYVDVTGSGEDPKKALSDALRNAVQVASGVLISSKIELVNDTITKDELAEFSAGYVSWYEIKKTYELDRVSYVEIGALISSSKLLSTYLFESSASGKVDGDQQYTRVSTYLRSKQQGDKLLEHLADSYPTNAIETTLGKVSSIVTGSREIWLIIPYRMKWSKGYLDAFRETVGYLSDTSCLTGTDKQPRNCEFNVATFEGSSSMLAGRGYTLSDKSQSRILLEHFYDEVMFQVTVEDHAGDEIGLICQSLQLPNQFLSNNENQLSLFNTVIEGQFKVRVDKSEHLNEIAYVKVSAVKSCSKFKT